MMDDTHRETAIGAAKILIEELIGLEVKKAVLLERERCIRIVMECEEVSILYRQLIAREIESAM